MRKLQLDKVVCIEHLQCQQSRNENLRGNAGGVVGAASSGNSSLNIFAANNPVENY